MEKNYTYVRNISLNTTKKKLWVNKGTVPFKYVRHIVSHYNVGSHVWFIISVRSNAAAA